MRIYLSITKYLQFHVSKRNYCFKLPCGDRSGNLYIGRAPGPGGSRQVIIISPGPTGVSRGAERQPGDTRGYRKVSSVFIYKD